MSATNTAVANREVRNMPLLPELGIGGDQVPAPDHCRWQPATLSLTLPLRLHRFSTNANGVVRPVNSMF
jgi:hypothetical protein